VNNERMKVGDFVLSPNVSSTHITSGSIHRFNIVGWVTSRGAESESPESGF